jgi:solute carrier family 25 carnitine/acylcarnitine transporter 20/29
MSVASSSESSPSSSFTRFLSPLKHFIGGQIGGVFGLTLAYPLDTVKVRMQTRPAGTYKGMVDCLSTLIRVEGFSSLYRGIASPVLGYGFIKSAAFGSYNQCKGWMQGTSGKTLNLAELTACGAYAGFFQTFVRAPVEQIKVVMQARNKPGTTQPPYRSSWACIVEVYKTEGIKQGFYRSFIPTLSREIPQYAIYYPSYEVARRLFLAPGQSVDSLHPVYTAIAGGLAGVAQWIPTFPLDVIKSRVSAAPPGTYKGFADCALQLYKTEGATVFWRGISAAIMRAFPLHGGVFLAYEMSVKLIK